METFYKRCKLGKLLKFVTLMFFLIAFAGPAISQNTATVNLAITPTTVCQNGSVYLTITLTPAPPDPLIVWDFSYSMPGGGVTTVTNYNANVYAATLYPTGSGQYTLLTYTSTTYTLSPGTTSATVTVNPTPDATVSTSAAEVCLGGTEPVITFTPSNGSYPYDLNYNVNGTPYTVTITSGTATVTQSTAIAGTFTYTLTNISYGSFPDPTCSQTQTETITVVVNPLPTGTISGSTSVCKNGTLPTVTFTGILGEANFIFDYTDNTGTHSVTSTGNTATITQPTATAGTLTVTLNGITDNNGCYSVASGTVTIIVNDLPTGTISGTTTVCENATAPNITFTGTAGPAPFTFHYNINGDPTQTVTTTSGNSVTVPQSTAAAGSFVYTLEKVVDANFCEQTQSGTATITVNASPTASIGGTTTVCKNATAPDITFTGATGVAPYTFTYKIDGGPDLTVTSVTSTATVSQTTIATGTFVYTLVSVSDGNSCSQAQSGTVTITVQEPTASIGGTTGVCQNATSPDVTFTGANGTAPYIFSYDINGGATVTVTTTSVTSTVTVPAPTVITGIFAYNLTAVSDAICTSDLPASGTATITVNTIPTATMTGDATVCKNGTAPAITFVGANGTSGYIFNYTIAPGGSYSVTTTAGTNTTTVTQPTGTAGTYVYTLTSVEDANGCSQTQTATVTILVNDLPTGTISGTTALCQNSAAPNVTFTGTSGVQPFTFYYTVNGSTQSVTTTSPSTTVTVSQPTTTAGIYVYELTSVADANSCSQAQSGTATITVNATPAATANHTPEPICSGTNLNLTAGPSTGITTYSWVGPGSFSNSGTNYIFVFNNVSTANMGTFTVTVTDGNGCSATATTYVTVEQSVGIPTAPAGTLARCAGAGTDTYTTSVTGATSFNWTVTPGAATYSATTTTGSVTLTWEPTFSGTATITVTGTNTCGTSSPTSTAVTVNPIPVAQPGSNSPVCVGSPLNLTGGSDITVTSWAWTGPGLTTSTQNPIVDPVVAGTYTLVVTTSSTCSSSPVATVVSTQALPIAGASSNSPVCSIATLNLYGSSTATSTTSWSWTGPGGYSSTVQNPTITPSVPGTYTLTIVGDGCTSTATSTVVVVNTTPVATASSVDPTICSNETLYLLGSSTPSATSWAWTGPGGYSSTAQNPVLTSPVGGTYSLIATLNSCASTATTTVVTVNTAPAATATHTPEPICTGQTLNLTAGPTTGITTYSWSGPGPFTNVGPNYLITLNNVAISNEGTFTVTVTDGNGCVGTATTYVNVDETVGTPSGISGGTNPRCIGAGTDTFTTSAIGANSYTWTVDPASAGTFSGTTDTEIFTWNAAFSGTATISVTATNACGTSSPTTTAIVVNPLPVAQPSSNTPVCDGSTLNLTGGSNIPASSWTWTGPGFSSALQNPTVSPVVAGTYTLVVTSTEGCTSLAVATQVAITTLPVATATSNLPVCTGGSLNLTGASSITPVTLWSWTGPGGYSSTVQNPTITPPVAGTYTLVVTANACPSTATTTTVVVYPTPVATASSNAPICSNLTLNLTGGSSEPAGSWLWTGPGTYSSTLQSPSIAVPVAGIYTLIATSADGCASTATSTTVTVYTAPVATAEHHPEPVCVGQTLYLTAGPSGMTTYSWQGPASFNVTTAITNISLFPIATNNGGTYTVTVYDANNCTSFATTFVTVQNPVGTPSAPSGTLSRCQGAGTDTYTTSATGATSYNWSVTGGAATYSATTVTGSVTLTWVEGFSGTATITVTGTNSCGTSSPTSTAVTVKPLPIAIPTSNSPVCVGGILNLTGSSNLSPITSYSWTGPGGFTDLTQYPTRNPVVAGTYTLVVTVNGCTSAPVAIEVTTKDLPVATASSNTPVCSASTLNLTGSSNISPVTSWSWTGPDSWSSTVQNPSVTPPVPGTYYLTVVANGCSSTTTSTVVAVFTNPVTTVWAVDPTICSNEILYLMSSSTPTATSWSWTGPGGYSSTAQNPVVTSPVGGTYTLIATVDGCSSTATSTVVTVYTAPVVVASHTAEPICVGQTLHLTGEPSGGVYTYTWAGPGSFSNIGTNHIIDLHNVSLSNAGTFTLTVVDVNGCTNWDTTLVHVESPVVTPSAPSGTLSRCQGAGTDTYTTSATNATSYNWTVTAGAATYSATTSTGSVTLTWLSGFSGTATITVTGTNSCGTSASASTGVTVMPLPVAQPTSNSPVCFDGTLNLTGGSTITGSAWAWTGPSSFTSSLQNPTRTPVVTGTYTLVVTATNGCTSLPVGTIVTTKDLPVATATSNSPVCSAATLNLTGSSNTTPVTSWSWTGPGSWSSTVQNPSVTPPVPGTYYLTVVANGCSSTVTSTVVVVKTTPVATATSDSPVCSNETLNLTGTSTSGTGTTWSWTGPGTFSSTLQNPAVTSPVGGTYSLIATYDGCSSTVATTVVTVYTAPVAEALHSPEPVCVGQTLNLTGLPNGMTTYSWVGPGSFSNVGSNTYITLFPVSLANQGTFTLTVTDGNLCQSVASTYVTVQNPVGTPSTPSGTTLRCQGAGTDTYTTTAANATSYNWSVLPVEAGTIVAATGVMTWNAAFSGTATITVTGTNSCGTSVPASVGVTVKPLPVAIPTSNSPVCVGGTLNLTGNSNLTPVTSYAWSGPGEFTSTLQYPTRIPVVAGTYTLVVTVNGCLSAPVATVVTTKELPVATASSNSPVCSASTLNLTGSSSITPVTSWLWTGPSGYSSTVQNPSVTSPVGGTYVLTVVANGCSSTATSTVVVVNTTPVATASSNSPICSNLTLNLTGSVSPSGSTTWSWTGPGTFSSTAQNPAVTNPVSGTYSLIATQNGCASIAATTIVTVYDAPVAVATHSPEPVCVGGTLMLTAAPPTGILTYTWNGPSGFYNSGTNYLITLNNVSLSNQGTYTLTVFDANNCSSQHTTYVTVQNVVGTPTTPSGTTLRCQGAGTDTYTATATNATSYTWTVLPAEAGTMVAATGVITWNASFSGTATITVVGNNSCGASPSSSLGVTVKPLPIAQPTSNSPVCIGGILNLSGSSNLSPVTTYAWTGPGFSSSLQNPTVNPVVAGTYTLVVTVNGCSSAPVAITVTTKELPVATATSNSPVCSSATLTLTGSSNITPVTSWSWTGPSNYSSTVQNPSITPPVAGVYTLVVVANGCSSTITSTVVVVNTTPVALASSNTPVCSNVNLNLYGSSTPTATSWSWTGPGTFSSTAQNPVVSNPVSGTYNLVATLNGCSSTVASTVVVVNTAPVAVATHSPEPVCVGQSLNLTGAPAGMLLYTWVGPGSFSNVGSNTHITLSPVSAANQGTFTLTVEDANHCLSVATTYVTVQNPVGTPAIPSGTTVRCQGAGTDTYTTTASGATSYNWSVTPAGAGTIVAATGVMTWNASFSGTATITVTGTNACGTSVPASLGVTVKPLPVAIPTSNSPVCTGGALNLTGSSSITGATFAWTGPGFSSSLQNPTVSPVVAGTYTLVVTANGCVSAPVAIAVTATTLPVASITSNSPVCSTSTLTLSGSSTITPVTMWSWTGPNNFSSTVQNPTISSPVAGTYSLIVVANGCSSMAASTVVVVKTTPVATASAVDPTVCSNLTLNLLGSSTPTATSWAWTGPNGYSSTVQNPNVTSPVGGTYTLIATLDGCSSAPASTIVTVYTAPVATATHSPEPVCVGSTLYLTAGPAGMSSYGWVGPAGFNVNVQITNISLNPIGFANAGTYTVTVTDLNGCTSVATTDVNVQPPAGTPVITSGTTVRCQGAGTDTYTATSTNATSFTWSVSPVEAGTMVSATGVMTWNAAFSGSATIIVTGNNACGASPATSITVTVKPLPVAIPTSNSPVCVGGTLNLTGNSSITPVSAWLWTGPSYSSNQQNNSLTPVVPGTYTLVVTVDGCTSAPVAIVVETKALPVAIPTSNSPVCSTGTLNLTGASNTTPVTSWSWTGPANYSSTVQSPVVTSPVAGTYYLTVVANGCTSAPVGITVVVNTTPVATASSNSPVCSNSVLNLIGSSVPTATSWSWTGPGSFTSNAQNPTVTNPLAGTYSLIATLNGCSSTAATTVVVVNPAPVPIATSNSPVCVGSTLTLTGLPAGLLSYAWTGPAGFNITSPVNVVTFTPMSAANAGTYTLVVTEGTNMCTAIATTVVVVSDPSQGGTVAANQTICYNTEPANLLLTGQFGDVVKWQKASDAGFLTAVDIPVTSTTLLGTTIGPLTANTYFRAVVKNGGCAEAYSSSVLITVTPLPTVAIQYNGTPYCTSGGTAQPVITATGTTGTGTFVADPSGLIISATTGFITLATSAPGTYTVTYTTNGVGGCSNVSVSASTQVVVTAAPNVTFYYPLTPYCVNYGTASVVRSGLPAAGVGTYSYTGTGTLALNPATGSVTTASSTPGTYTVILTIPASGGCGVYTTNTTITITSQPVISISYAGTPYCSNAGLANVTQTGPTNGTYAYSGPQGKTLALNTATGQVTLGSSDAGTYTVTYTVPAGSGCPEVSTSTLITITALPTASFYYQGPYCSNQGIVSPIFDGTTGGVFSAPTALSLNTATGAVNLGTSTAGTYTVTYTIASANGCPAVVTTATITIKQATLPTATSNSPLCTGSTLELTGSPATGIIWYSWSGPGFTSAGTVNTATLSPVSVLNNGTYYLTVTAENLCTATTSVEVVVSALSVGGTINPATSTICEGGSAVLTVSGITGTVQRWEYSLDGTFWFLAATTNATTYTAANLTQTTMYRAIVKSGVCAEAISATATVNVTPYPTATIAYATPVCTTGGTILPAIGGTTGGTFQSAPAGLTLNEATGAVTLGTSLPGTYTVTYTVSGSGGCSNVVITATAPITVTAAPTASISYAGTPYCSNTGTALVTQIGTTGGTYTATPAGLSINASSGAVNLGASAGGTYIVSYTIPAAGGCDEVIATTQIVVLTAPVPVATSNSPVCDGGTLNLTGTPATGISNYSWIGPGFISSGSVNIASLTPFTIGNAGTYQLTVTANNGCVATTSTVVLMAPAPVGGTVTANQSICYNTAPASLNLNGNVGNVVKWQKSTTFNFAVATDILVTSTTLPGSVIGPLTVTTYFRAVVQSGTCAPVNSSSVVIVVTPVPMAPVVSVTNNCGSSTLTASAYTGTLLWSTGATTASITVTTPGNYTVTQTIGNCVSLPGTGVAAPMTIPAAPVVTVVNNCGNSVLTASGFTGTLLWSTGETTTSITVNTAGTYTVAQTVGQCTSPAGSGVAAPKVIPSAPVVLVANNCGNSTLTASGYTGTLLWSTGETTAAITVTIAGTYTVNQTVNGCVSPAGSGVAAPKATPTAPVVTVVNNLGSSVLTASGYTGTLLWSTGETTSSITVTVAGTYFVTQTVDGCTSPAGSGVAAPIENATIAGYVKYNNNYATGMNGVTVQLCTPGGTVISTAVTATSGGAGYYSFSGVTAGTYRLRANFGGAWLGANATDANIVQQHVAGLLVPPLQFLRNTVADVNASGIITSLDAAMINQRFVGLITSFPAGDWKFTDTTFTLIGNVNIDLKALCVGDVNGSDIPTGAKESSFLNAVDDGVMTVPVNSSFTYEIRSNEIADLGAMSLIMNFDQTRFTVNKVNTSLEGLVYNITDGRVALAWSDTKALSLKNDETVISLQITAKETLTEPVQIFTIGGGSEFADASANRIENFDLKMTKVVTASGDANFFMYNYPNPFRNTTEIVYSIPEDGKVILVLTNMYGQTIRTLVNETKAAGTYKVKVDLSDGYLKTGVYLYRIDVEGATNSYNKTNKMMLTR